MTWIRAWLAAEITVRLGRDPGEIYADLTREFGEPVYERGEAPATLQQKAVLETLTPEQVNIKDLAGEKSGRSSPTRRATVHPSED